MNPQHPVVDISIDGVQESNSSNVSMDVYSIKFKNCRNIYPIKIIKPFNRFKYNEQEEIAKVVADLNENNVDIDTAVFDNLKRSVAKNVKSHAATHPCEYCECGAVSYMDENMNRHKLTWPPSTMNGRPRTLTAIRRIVNSIETDNEPPSKNYLKGIKGRSVFLDQPNFDMILDMPTEYMHSVCLGLVKKMVELTYSLGKKRVTVTKKKRLDTKLFNDLICKVKVFRECSRRCRNLETSVYKALEYRNLILFFFFQL